MLRVVLVTGDSRHRNPVQQMVSFGGHRWLWG